MIKEYSILKINIKEIVNSNYDLHISQDEEYKYLIKQQNTPLFEQIKIIRGGYDKEQIDELVFVVAKHSKKRQSQLEKLLREGFKYNDRKYVRFGKSSSQGKQGITVFVYQDFYDELTERSQLGVSIAKCIIPKYEGYRCLIFSSCQFIENGEIPNIVIVDEYTKILPHQYVRYAVVKDREYIDKNTQQIKKIKNCRTIEEGYRDIKISPFDGFGIHTKKMSDIWSKYLDNIKDYVPIAYQLRIPFFKGISVEAPIQEYYESIGVDEIVDIFGVAHKVADIDCIWNVSMWKGYGIFKEKYGDEAWNEYIKKLQQYGYKLGISKYSHHIKDIDLYSRTNFQYLQCLNLVNPKYVQHFKNREEKYNILNAENDGKIISLAKYSTNLIEKIIKGDKFYTLKFLGINDSDVDSVNGKYVEAILTNDEMLNDPCIRNMLRRKLNKTIQQMKYGKIYTHGFYHTIVGDIVGYLEYCANKNIKGCLNAGEFYLDTLQSGDCLSFRSPLVDPSEVNKVKIVHNDITDKYFQYFKDQDVCMINMYDLTMPQQGGCDFDGDSVDINDDPILVSSKINKPIVVDIDDKKSIDPIDYNTENIIKYECNSRDSRIGEITNVATSILNQCTDDKYWQKVNEDNVSLLRLYQGKEIDFLKTGYRWVLSKGLRRYLKKIPYFLLYNYPEKLNVYNKIKSINKTTDKDDRIPYNAYKSSSPMNELCDYICQWERHHLVWDRKVTNTGYLLVNKKYDLSNRHITKSIRQILNSFKMDFQQVLDRDEVDKHLSILFDEYKKLLYTINLDYEHLANYCISVSYRTISEDKILCWALFGDIIIKNLKENSKGCTHSQIINADINDAQAKEFLGKYYKLVEEKGE